MSSSDQNIGFAALLRLNSPARIPQFYVGFKPYPWLDFSVGYAKPPLFASSTHEPVHLLTFPDYSPLISSFSVARDLGADVHLQPASLPVEAWARIGNGTGSALGNDNALPAGYAMIDLVLGRAHTARPDAASQTWGLRIGAAGFFEKSEDREGIAGMTPHGFRYYRPPVVSGARMVGEAHIVGYVGPFQLAIEGAMAREGRSRDTDGNPDKPRVSLPSVLSHGVSVE